MHVCVAYVCVVYVHTSVSLCMCCVHVCVVYDVTWAKRNRLQNTFLLGITVRVTLQPVAHYTRLAYFAVGNTRTSAVPPRFASGSSKS